jgi:hypothetical protein
MHLSRLIVVYLFNAHPSSLSTDGYYISRFLCAIIRGCKTQPLSPKHVPKEHNGGLNNNNNKT